jgi:hypothetical protein
VRDGKKQRDHDEAAAAHAAERMGSTECLRGTLPFFYAVCRRLPTASAASQVDHPTTGHLTRGVLGTV